MAGRSCSTAGQVRPGALRGHRVRAAGPAVKGRGWPLWLLPPGDAGEVYSSPFPPEGKAPRKAPVGISVGVLIHLFSSPFICLYFRKALGVPIKLMIFENYATNLGIFYFPVGGKTGGLFNESKLSMPAS